jgi:hypothetical protein
MIIAQNCLHGNGERLSGDLDENARRQMDEKLWVHKQRKY